MTDLSVTNYNPYNMYWNYGYYYPYYPSFRSAATSTNTIQNQTNNVPQMIPQPDSVSFSANEQVQKQGLSTGAKVAIGAGIVTVLAVGADFIFCKGKHIKSIFGKNNKGNKPNSPKPPTNNEKAAETAEQNTKPAVNTDIIKSLDSSNAIKADEYESLEKAVENYRAKINSGEYGVPPNIENLLNSLSGHNYGNDKSFIQVTTRTKKHDYITQVLDVEKNEYYKTRVLESSINLPDMEGNYLVTTLPTGQKLVSISIPTGRYDVANRQIRTIMSVLSKDKELTPLQKDMIEIISNRKDVLTQRSNNTDILSIGVLANNTASPYSNRTANPIEFNKEVLLASISKAKQLLKESDIDKQFIEKALNIKDEERIARINH